MFNKWTKILVHSAYFSFSFKFHMKKLLNWYYSCWKLQQTWFVVVMLSIFAHLFMWYFSRIANLWNWYIFSKCFRDLYRSISGFNAAFGEGLPILESLGVTILDTLSPFWAPALGEVSCVHPSVRITRSKNWLISFIWFFCREVSTGKVRKVTKANFWIRVPIGQKSPESPKMRLLEFWQKSNLLIFTFSHEYESTSDRLTFCKTCMPENLVLELWSKNLQTNQNAGFFKLQYLTNVLSCDVEFLYAVRNP